MRPEINDFAGSNQSKLHQLLAHRRDFLRFLQRRVSDGALAEDLLQDALARSVPRLGSLREGEALVGWFYKVLDNALIDHWRRRDASRRGLERAALEWGERQVESADGEARPCRCVLRARETLKPDYAAALERIELDEVAVKDFAQEAGISRQNAAVRVFRARKALHAAVLQACGGCAQSGCGDCSCA